MDRLLELSKKAAEKIRKTNSAIHIVSHYDADGIIAAAIIATALRDLKKSFQISIVKRITPKVIENVNEKNPELVIFTDIGSGYLDQLKKLNCFIIIADHHQIKGNYESDRIIHINPELFQMEYISGSSVTYFLARELTDNDKLAPLSIVGTIGDLGAIPGHTKDILKGNPNIKKQRGLNIFGRFTRPIHKALCYSFGNIPSLSNESKSLQFLSELKIPVQDNGNWRTLSHLTEEEKRKITDALIREYISHSQHINDIFTDVWTLENFPDELKDAKEFATLLNSCGRLGKSAVGLGMCLGSHSALEEARTIMNSYRRMIGKYLNFLRENPEYIRETEKIKFIIAKDKIHENLIGTIVSMCHRSSPGKPIIGLANSDDGIKVSARGDGSINMNEIISKAALECGGISGGHKEAAGAMIPAGCEEKFIEICNKLISS